MIIRIHVVAMVLGVLIAGSGVASAGQPDNTPDTGATTSRPIDDRDTATPDRAEGALEDAADAVASGRWMVVAGLVLMALVKLAREGADKLGGRWLWFKTDRGGAVLALSIAGLGELGLILSSGRPPSLSGVAGAVVAACVAAGGRNLIGRILNPRDRGAPATVSG